MTGFNTYLPKEEKVQCLLCLSSNDAIEKADGTILCSDCGSTIQSFHPSIDLVNNQVTNLATNRSEESASGN